jgi:hypothetical protein
MIVGLDSDGCIDTFGDGVHDALKARGLGHLWKSGPTKRAIWNFFEEWKNEDGSPWTFAQFKELVDWGVDEGYVFAGHWRDGAIDAVKRIKALGHTVVIITDRSWGSHPFHSQRNTVNAFERAGIEYDELIFSADKTIVPTDIFVEDRLENYDALVEAGTVTYLINRTWNEVPGGDARNRIDSIGDFADIVEDLTEAGVVDLAFV